MKIIEVDFGIANTYDDRIEINKHLNEPEFRDLKARIIAHELEHTRTKGFWKQRKVDAFTEIKFRDLFPFYKKYPKAFFQQHLPITYKDNIIYLEWSLILLYISWTVILSITFFLIRAFSSDSIMFWEIIKYIIIGLGIVWIIYLGGKELRNYINNQAKQLEKVPTINP